MIIPSPIVISPSSSTLPLSETNVKLSPLSIASLAVAAVILSLLFPKDCVLFRPTQHKEGYILFRRLFFLACHKHIVAYIYLRRSYNILIVVYLVTGNRNIVYTEKTVSERVTATAIIIIIPKIRAISFLSCVFHFNEPAATAHFIARELLPAALRALICPAVCYIDRLPPASAGRCSLLPTPPRVSRCFRRAALSLVFGPVISFILLTSAPSSFSTFQELHILCPNAAYL